jgi:hypothetical protein
VSDAAKARREIRPTGRRPRSAIAIIAWTGAVVCNLLALHGSVRIITACASIAGLLALLLLMHRWRHRALLELSGDTLTYTGVLKSRVIARRPLTGQAVTATVRWPGSGRTTQRWLLLDAAGNAQLALDLPAWDPDQLHELADRLGVPQDVDPTPRRAVELRRKYPGGVHWVAAHPYWFTLLLIAAASTMLLALSCS